MAKYIDAMQTYLETLSQSFLEYELNAMVIKNSEALSLNVEPP